jgi:hypothetical protein
MQAGALEVEERATVAGDPAEVWARMGAFGAIGDWHPAVIGCETGERDGAATRTLSLAGGGALLEQRLEAGPTSYAYTILDGPLPVARYRSELRAEAAEGGTRLVWRGAFDARGGTDDEARATIRGIYRAGLDALAARWSGPGAADPRPRWGGAPKPVARVLEGGDCRVGRQPRAARRPRERGPEEERRHEDEVDQARDRRAPREHGGDGLSHRQARQHRLAQGRRAGQVIRPAPDARPRAR